MARVAYQVEYRTLDFYGQPVTMVAYLTTSLEGVTTEQAALQKARERRHALGAYHLFVDIVRIGPRGGRKTVS